jgi:charged multivesicular body protein 3
MISEANTIQAGIMEEMMDDTLEMQDEEEIEEEADAEVDKVLFELTNGKLGEAGSVGTGLPVRVTFPAVSILN